MPESEGRQSLMGEIMDRAGLYAALEKFLAALNAGDYTRLDWAPGAFHSENNVMLEIGGACGLSAYTVLFRATNRRTAQAVKQLL